MSWDQALLLTNPYANIEGQRIVVIPQQCKQRRTLNVYKVLLCLHCWGITTIRCPSMLAYGLANNNLACISSIVVVQILTNTFVGPP